MSEPAQGSTGDVSAAADGDDWSRASQPRLAISPVIGEAPCGLLDQTEREDHHGEDQEDPDREAGPMVVFTGPTPLTAS